MTDQNPKDPNTSKTGRDRFQEEFNALPLEEKFKNLFQMEVATLNDAFTYVADSSMKVFEKVGDAISDLGSKIENEARKATCPDAPEPAAREPKASAPKAKPRAKRKPAPRSANP